MNAASDNVPPFRILVTCTGKPRPLADGPRPPVHLGGERVCVDSAVVEPKGVHPMAVRVMTGVGIDISGNLFMANCPKTVIYAVRQVV